MINKTEQEIMRNWKGDITKPVVSICCITYNHENYIAEALDSFLMQETDFVFEVIVRDDASPDKTADIIKEYEIKYPNIIKPIYEKENGYQKGIKASPVAFAKAKGEYIALCEGDDYWTDPKKLQIQKDFLDNNQDYVICYTNCQPFNENGFVDIDFGGARRDLTSEELQKATPIFTLTTMFRNVLPEKFPPEYQFVKYGDLFLWSMVGQHGNGKYFSDIKPSMYRVHLGGIFSKKGKLAKKEMLLDTLFSLYITYRSLNNKKLELYFMYRFMKLSFIIILKKYFEK